MWHYRVSSEGGLNEMKYQAWAAVFLGGETEMVGTFETAEEASIAILTSAQGTEEGREALKKDGVQAFVSEVIKKAKLKMWKMTRVGSRMFWIDIAE